MKPDRAQVSMEAAAACLRDAMAVGLHGQAQTCLMEYCRRVEETVRGLPRGDPRIVEIQNESTALLEWVRRQALAARAHCAARLAALSSPTAYRVARARTIHTWQFEA